VRCVKTWGTACFVGEGGEVTLDVSPDLLPPPGNAHRLMDLHRHGMLECARFIADRGTALEKIFTHRWRLEQSDEAYRSFDTQTTRQRGLCSLGYGSCRAGRT
jgi:hypothetical protein